LGIRRIPRGKNHHWLEVK